MRRPLATPRIRLVCLPYAGGGASTYQAWADHVPADVEVRSVQLPARQDRFGERPLVRVAAIVEHLVAALATLPAAPLALYGHSFGGTVAYEIARRLAASGTPPVALVVGAARAPHLGRSDEPIHGLGEADFLEAIHRRYGTLRDVLQNAELMPLVMPALRADIEALETYVFSPGPALQAPIAVLRGRHDATHCLDDEAAWSELSALPTDLREIDAGHFFVDTHRTWVLAQLGGLLGKTPSLTCKATC